MMKFAGRLLLGILFCAALAPAGAYSDEWPNSVVHYLAQTQVALDECSWLAPDWARAEMPKSTGLSAEEIEKRVAEVLPSVREKLLKDTAILGVRGSALCKVAFKIYGPDGSVPYFLKRR